MAYRAKAHASARDVTFVAKRPLPRRCYRCRGDSENLANDKSMPTAHIADHVVVVLPFDASAVRLLYEAASRSSRPQSSSALRGLHLRPPSPVAAACRGVGTPPVGGLLQSPHVPP